ncbi:transcription initiation factor tfiid subunit 10 [Vairimorpha apis BRL 01]|uniref:Transcription initiation factor tfiid subunit 10 n=1 Tax=Vairimorpha apis BRL 01 TaxID=1037528 RepID=T0L854_9MICR|nr:transcription initiation factor tfiid subunit 10 [Vairimorpha apis BRL 01]
MKNEDFEEFKKHLDEYIPIIPDSVIDYYMQKSGVISEDERLKKLVSLLSHKFISDVCTRKKITLQVIDVEKALEEAGINAERPYYYM